MSVLIVAGALANKYRNGGGTWERMSWAVGLRQLGFDVYFVEQIAPQSCVDAAGATTSFDDSVNLAWFNSVTTWFGMADRSALIYGGGEQCAGMPWPRLLEMAESAALLVNLSGHLTIAPLLDRIPCKAYIDVDPGFTQFWHADPSTAFHVGGHEHYFTIGENIGSPDCPIPTGGLHWRPIRQPLVLDQWPVVDSQTVARSRRERSVRASLAENASLDESHQQNATLSASHQHNANLSASHRQNATLGESRLRFTTIASWRGGFGPVQADGKIYGLKVHEFRKLLELPQRVSATFEIALDIHPADHKDRVALEQHGWQLSDPREVATDASAFRRYVQQSDAEFSVAQGIYVDTNSGWFSDRSVRYLASGKPVLVQDTGFGRHLPAGKGLVTFRTLDEAVAGAEAIAGDYESHCQAAREIAERYFDSDKVLGRLLEEVGVAP